MKFKTVIKTALKTGFQWLALPIRSGELKGKRWTVSSSSRLLRGNYETKRVALFARSLSAGDVVYDVGAHMGYYTLVASQTVGAQGRVFSFEPLAFNVRQLRRHVELNGARNVSIIEACVGEAPGDGHFSNNAGSGRNRLVSQGVPVKIVALDALVDEGMPLPHCIKIDVEGNELAVLEGARATIARAQPLLFMSFHGAELKEQGSALLHSWGYRQQDGLWRHDS